MATPDIEILVGAQGGYLVDGKSAKLIQDQLKNQLSKGIKVNIKIGNLDELKQTIANLNPTINTGTNAGAVKSGSTPSQGAHAADYDGVIVVNRKIKTSTDELVQAKKAGIKAINDEKVAIQGIIRVGKEAILAQQNRKAAADADAAEIQKRLALRREEIIVIRQREAEADAEAAESNKRLALKREEVAITRQQEAAQKKATQSERQATNATLNQESAISKASKALADFNKYLTTVNPKVFKEMSGQLEQVRIAFQGVTNGNDLKKANSVLTAFKAGVKSAGYEGGNAFTYVQEKIKTFATYMASSHLTNAFINSFRKMIDITYDLNEALVNLQIVTGSSAKTTTELLRQYNQMAQELGSTTATVASAAVEWQRQGYNIEDTNELIKDSMILSVVGMVESADAAQYLTSAIKGNRKIPFMYRECA